VVVVVVQRSAHNFEMEISISKSKAIAVKCNELLQTRSGTDDQKTERVKTCKFGIQHTNFSKGN
jgi:hypothetical protein